MLETKGAKWNSPQIEIDDMVYRCDGVVMGDRETIKYLYLIEGGTPRQVNLLDKN